MAFGLRIRWNRLRKSALRNERCDICGKRMPLNGTGISETIGLIRIRYHTHCYLNSPAASHEFAVPNPEESKP